MLDIRLAQVADAPAVARLALAQEIATRTGARSFDMDERDGILRCEDSIRSGRYLVTLAVRFGQHIGFASLSESLAVCGCGCGIIQEFFVLPGHRSRGVGRRILQNVKRQAALRGMTDLELCAPPLPEFQRTVDFYLREGFGPSSGGRMRCPLG